MLRQGGGRHGREEDTEMWTYSVVEGSRTVGVCYAYGSSPCYQKRKGVGTKRMQQKEQHLEQIIISV